MANLRNPEQPQSIELELRPNVGPESAPMEWTASGIAALGLLGLFALVSAFVGYRLQARARRKDTLSPLERALQELEAIGRVSEPGQACVQVADVLRRYLSKRFQLSTLRQTTAELAEDIERINHLSKDNKERIVLLLHVADVAKFAEGETNQENVTNVVSVAKQVVEECS